MSCMSISSAGRLACKGSNAMENGVKNPPESSWIAPLGGDDEVIRARLRDISGFLSDVRVAAEMETHGIALRASFRLEAYAPRLFEALGVALPPAVQRAVPKRQAEFLCGRFLAQLAVQRLTGEWRAIEVGGHREPLWPEGVSGSL